MPFKNLFTIAFGEKKNSNSPSIRKDGSDENHVVAPCATMEKDATESEIGILEERYGELKEGTVLWIDLQTLLKIIPRKRQRTDAYNRLVKALEQRGVTLCITSRKRKKE